MRRSELHSDEGTRSPTPDEDAIERLKDMVKIDFISTANTNHEDLHQQVDRNEDEGLEFRLFAQTKATDLTDSTPFLQKIRLRSPSVTDAEPGFVHLERENHYYFAETLSPTGEQRLNSVALSGAQVLARSHIQWPGSTYDWKVLQLPSYTNSASSRAAIPAVLPKLATDDAVAKRRRPGKKSRIKTRTRLAAERLRRKETQKSALEKEAAEREKRTQRNREKKVKKKLREKAKKMHLSPVQEPEASATAEADGGPSAGSGEQSPL